MVTCASSGPRTCDVPWGHGYLCFLSWLSSQGCSVWALAGSIEVNIGTLSNTKRRPEGRSPAAVVIRRKSIVPPKLEFRFEFAVVCAGEPPAADGLFGQFGADSLPDLARTRSPALETQRASDPLLKNSSARERSN